jgi:phosphotransferase system HPr (HPr) family protein
VADARRTLTVVDREGLHARPCARIARAAQKFASTVTAAYDGRVVDAKSVLELLGLMAAGGEDVEFHAVGDDADACLDAVAIAMAKSE